MPDLSLADLTRITGAKRRSVQLWSEAGVIRANPDTERKGIGVHRRFSENEAVIACIVHALAHRQMPVGQLLAIAELLRREADEDSEIWAKVTWPLVEPTCRNVLIITLTDDPEIPARVVVAGLDILADIPSPDDALNAFAGLGLEAVRYSDRKMAISYVIEIRTYLTGLFEHLRNEKEAEC